MCPGYGTGAAHVPRMLVVPVFIATLAIGIFVATLSLGRSSVGSVRSTSR